MKKRRFFLFLILFVLGSINKVYAGPPFNTDDPQPVDYKHWEYYIASIHQFQPGLRMGTLPHFEINYGIVKNVQIHVLLPLNYLDASPQPVHMGYGYSELGVKYRFVQETENTPQIGIFPIVEIPTVPNNEFNNGKAQWYIPVWLQKSFGKWTSYGGVGYWINPGEGNKNWIFTGWELQCDISSFLMLGGEIYYHSASTTDSNAVTGFNLGGSLNFTEKFHLIFSAGHSLSSSNLTSAYAGLLWTI